MRFTTTGSVFKCIKNCSVTSKLQLCCKDSVYWGLGYKGQTVPGA